KKLILFAFSIVLLVGLVAPASAGPATGQATADVIVLAEGSTDALVAHIESLGGTVRLQYRNVPAVAATIPAGTLGQVSGFAGVLSVHKDLLVSLPKDMGTNRGYPASHAVQPAAGVEVRAVDPAAIDLGALPQGYANFQHTGAYDVWGETGMGDGSIVAVIDTGVVPNTCLEHAIIGAPGYPEGYNASGDGLSATDPANHWHGTIVGGVIASYCYLDFTGAEMDPLYLAQQPYLGWPVDFVPVFGQAPGAELYPVKVFPADGSSVPISTVLAGFDHVLTLKNEGLLEVDIVNLSAGWPTGWDGRGPYDVFMEKMVEAGILVVAAAANSGPIPNSVASPATSFDVLSVGALDYAASSRVFYEFAGFIWGLDGDPETDDPVSGMGLVMRPTDETRVIEFSSRGPLSDGRFGPEIVALGIWNFHQLPNGYFDWFMGTSFSSPTVAGGAALLNAYWEGLGYETDPVALENALLLGADPEVVGASWQDINDQGYGALDVPAALDHLASGDVKLKPAAKVGELAANVLGPAVPGKREVWNSDTITLAPGEVFNAVWEISDATSKVTIQVRNIDTPDNSGWATWPNSLVVHLAGGKRTATYHPLVVWFPHLWGKQFDIVVEDGPWTLAGGPWHYEPMQPGLMKLSFVGDWVAESPVSFKVHIMRENYAEPLENRVANGVIKNGDALFIPVQVPEGASRATFDLTWHRDWSMFPTSDIDMWVLDPDWNLASVESITMNAPERAVIDNPMPGEWMVVLDGYLIYKPDNWDLFVNIE
ncbi:MAG: S8 family serine peptidase, partial [Anaerolineae bacterium]|nr:S8 family serine peptidase [Anaerolineae bacterium]